MEVERCGDRGVLERIFKLRVSAWEHSMPGVLHVLHGEWSDTHDDHAEHWVILDEGSPIAAARMCVHNDAQDAPDAHTLSRYREEIPTPFASFNRLVVAPSFRGRGLATRLDRARLARAAELAVNAVVVSTQGRRCEALLSGGFRRMGAVRYPVGHPVHALDTAELFLKDFRYP